jgi:hypothetical protein
MNLPSARNPYLETRRAPADKSEFCGIFANAARAKDVLSTHPDRVSQVIQQR